jgi:predicted nucleotidyltransferase component of viral defense system
MEQIQIEKLAKSLKISSARIVQEIYEMIILKGLAESKIGKFLVFKGGTALRLIYGAPRFSEDLDFSVTQEFSERDFKEAVQGIAQKEPNLELVEALKKRWTFFALFKIKEPFLPQPLSVKVEVSIREKIREFETRIATSQTTTLEVLLKAFSLEQLLQDKLKTLRERQTAKDLFDVWYLAQKLKKEIDLPEVKINRKELKRDLHKLLPQNYWSVIEELSKLTKASSR